MTRLIEILSKSPLVATPLTFEEAKIEFASAVSLYINQHQFIFQRGIEDGRIAIHNEIIISDRNNFRNQGNHLVYLLSEPIGNPHLGKIPHKVLRDIVSEFLRLEEGTRIELSCPVDGRLNSHTLSSQCIYFNDNAVIEKYLAENLVLMKKEVVARYSLPLKREHEKAS